MTPEEENQITKAVDREIAFMVAKIPYPHMSQGITNYLRHGITGNGSFIFYMMSDSLVATIGHADDENALAIRKWASWLYNECPAMARGKHMPSWQARGGLLGITLASHTEKAWA